MNADDVLEFGASHVAIATGSFWRNDGVGRCHRTPLPFLQQGVTFTPDDLMREGTAAITPRRPVVLFDDDRFYLASVLAELVALAGHDTVFVTPLPIVAPCTEHTLEQRRIQRRLIELGITIIPSSNLQDRREGTLVLGCTYTDRLREIDCGTLIPITSRCPEDALWRTLSAGAESYADAGIRSLTRIGDCLAPGLIAVACQSGHALARQARDESTCEPRREDLAYLDDEFRATPSKSYRRQ